MRKIGVYWRALGTAFCFAIFGLLSLIASLTLLPVLIAWPGGAAARECRVRVFVSWSFRALLGAIAGLRLGYVDVEGREWLAQARGSLIVATHPMYLDIVALLALAPVSDCVVKSTMCQNRLYRRFVTAAGYISNGDSATLVDACVDSLRRGRNLILFPEGTRSMPGEALHFRRGAAQVAVRSGCTLLPVVIDCSPPALLKHSRWYQVPDRAWRLRIKICPPQPLSTFGHCERWPHGVAARRLTRSLETFFNEQLVNGLNEHSNRRTETAHHQLARS